MDTRPPITLREIAKRAKVSAATVSRTVNGVPTVHPFLVKRIRRVIEEMGYYPNTHARALVSGRSRTFGLMVSEITNPFFPEIVQTFAKLCVQHDYEILLSSIEQNSDMPEAAARKMIERRVDGVAILTFGGEEALIEIFRRGNIPVFAVNVDGSSLLLKHAKIDY
jgi:DNA-binding LacI/PurR family transcriptional regulator